MSLSLHPSGSRWSSISAALRFPEAVEPEEELNFLVPDEGADGFDAVDSSGSVTLPLRCRAAPSVQSVSRQAQFFTRNFVSIGELTFEKGSGQATGGRRHVSLSFSEAERGQRRGWWVRR